MGVLKVKNSLSYKPFEALGKVKTRKVDKEKQAAEREKFAGKCRICGAPLTLVPDTNVMICSNADCKGHAIKAKDENGKLKTVGHVPTFRCLYGRNHRYAERLFAEN